RQFDADMVEAFIRMVGIYPPGTLVELTTGEVALIVAVHPGKKLKPRVEVLLDTEKKAITPRTIDLANPTPGEQPQIIRPLPDGAFGISLQARIHQIVTDHRVYSS
ncbi:MAG: HD-GYP domain-containing protein, partial [Marinobacter sp.]|nr:HD-GYP domain-containing protein [Marinobacter sp.]